MKFAVSSSSLLFFLLGVEATWRFNIDDAYVSKDVRLVHATGEKVPMVYDTLNEQLLRVLPAKGFKETESSASESTSSTKESLDLKKNMLQVFHTKQLHIKLAESRPIDPKNSVNSFLGNFYTPDCSRSDSSDDSSSACSTSSCSSSSTSRSKRCHRGQPEMKLVSSSTSRTQVLGYPSLHSKCRYDSLLNNVLRVMTTANGETYILYPDSLVVLDDACQILRSRQFNLDKALFQAAKKTTNGGECIAVDFAMQEHKQLLMVGFEGLFAVVYDMTTLTVLHSELIFEVPDASPFYLMNSAMDWTFTDGCTKRFTARLFVQSGEHVGVWIVWFDIDTCCKKKSLSGNKGHRHHISTSTRTTSTTTSSSSSSVVEHTPATCNFVIPNPAIINDYEHQMDITIGRDPITKKLQLYSTRFTGPSINGFDQIERQCDALCLPPTLHCTVNQWSAIKIPGENAFFVQFTPSLDILRISYQFIHDTRP